MLSPSLTDPAAGLRQSGFGGGDLPGKLLFVVGAPRSGTTWMQLLLAQHPAVATANETHLFSWLNPFHRAWVEAQHNSPGKRSTGIRHYLSDDEFYAACRGFAAHVLLKIAASHEAPAIVLEKTPGHVHSAELILRLFPDAYFLHVIRDPRAVVASLLSAGRSWGASWAPKRATPATLEWRSAVKAGRRIRASTERYREIRYEDLLADTPGQLRQIFAWLGLAYRHGFPEQAAAACQLERLKGGSSDTRAPWDLKAEPAGFFRRGQTDGWREELSRGDVSVIEYLAGNLMTDLCYEPESPGPRRKPLPLLVQDVLDALRWRAQRWVNRLTAR